VLTPVAAPSVLGLFGFFAATIMVGSNLAGWWGTTSSGLQLFTFAAMFGGLAQLLAAMWSFRARDTAAVAVHGAWGSFWLAYGLQNLLVATGKLAPTGTHSVAFAWWFIALAAVTASVSLAVLAKNLSMFTVAGTLTAGSILAAIGYGVTGASGVLTAAGYLFVISAAAAWYAATAMMIAGSTGRTILPLGTWNVKGNLPARRPMLPIEYPDGMPGVKVGQ
jgi:succinate-acetate transporter protein